MISHSRTARPALNLSYLYSPLVTLRRRGGHWEFDVDWSSSFQYEHDDDTGDTNTDVPDEVAEQIDEALDRAFAARLLSANTDCVRIPNQPNGAEQT